MQTLSPLTRTERIIILSRIVLAAFSLLAIWLDPLEPEATASATFRILQVYFIYAACLLPVLLWLPLKIRQIGLFSHIIDVCLYSLLVTITQGSTSPFFSYFIFALLAAALRWQKIGILWSALAFLCLLLASGSFLEFEMHHADGGFELNRFIIRNVHLTIVALLLINLTTYEHQLRQELNKLSQWPLQLPSDTDLHVFVREILAYAVDLLETPRILMLWEEFEEPHNYLALWESDHLYWQKLEPSAYQACIAPTLADCHFLSKNIGAPNSRMLCMSPSGLAYRAGPGIDPLLIAKHAIQAVIGLSLKGQTFRGYLLLLDKPALNLDDLSLGILAAQQIATRIDQFYLHLLQQKTTAIEERIKMARDLHDGVLQTLTGIALQVKNIEHLAEKDPPAAQDALENLGLLIQAEQRHLRQFIQQLKPSDTGYPNTFADLDRRLQEIAHIIEQQWNLQVSIAIEPRLLPIRLNCLEDFYHLIREALINSARHADATQARVQLNISRASINIEINDNGIGFPFTGCYDLAKLSATGLGPKSLMDRTRALGGTLAIQSHRGYVKLLISLPTTSVLSAPLPNFNVATEQT